MRQTFFYAVTALVVSATLILAPQFISAASARSQHVKIMIHEDRLLFQSVDCLDQHIKEHLYARLVDKELTDRGHTAFSVDAVATIDKIIVDIEHWGDPEDSAKIAQAVADGIKKRPSSELVEQERALVGYEEGLLAEAPQLGASITAALLSTIGPSEVSCSAEQLQVAARNLSDWVPGDFEVYKSNDLGQYDRLDASQKSISTFPNAWDRLSLSPVETNLNSAVASSNALFVAYKGRADARSTTELLANIYDSLAGTGLEAGDVRPFGKAGFIIQGEGKVLVSIQDNLQTALSSSAAHQIQPNSLRQAWASICGFSTSEDGGVFQLNDERIAHTYFEYNTKQAHCEKIAEIPRAASGLNAFTKLLHIPKTSSEAPVYESEMSFDMCIPKEEFVREDLSVAAYALRQHLRFDLGLALNIQFSEIEGHCVEGAIFAPKANAGAISQLLTDFEPTRDAYAARYSSAEIIYNCSKESASRCPENNVRQSVEEVPELYIVFKQN